MESTRGTALGVQRSLGPDVQPVTSHLEGEASGIGEGLDGVLRSLGSLLHALTVLSTSWL